MNKNLFLACKENNLAEIKRLLSEGADINASDDLGLTPLLFACDHKNYALITFFLFNGADIHRMDSKGRNALMLLVEQTPFLSITDEYAAIPMPGFSEIMALGRGLSFVPKLGMTNSSLVDEVIDDIESVDNQKAIGKIALEAIKQTIDKAFIEKVIEKDEIHALNKMEVISYLLKNGIDLDEKDHDGLTALCYAKKYNDFDVVSFIESHVDNEALDAIIVNNGISEVNIHF